jgi:hypothetical protein
MKKLLLILLTFCSFGVANAQFEIGQPGDITMCSNSDFSTFNMTFQIPIVLDGLSPNDYTVTFHQSIDWAQADMEAISNPQTYINSGNPETIYVRVEQNSNPSNYEITQFTLIVNINPAIYNQEFTICDNDDNPADGLTMIDLAEVAEQIWSSGGYSPNDLELEFYASQSDANSQVSPLESPYQTTTVNQTIWVLSYHPGQNCQTISMVELNVLNCEGTCQTPSELTVANITSNGATFIWTAEGDETQWEVLVLYSGGPFPLPTMVGTVVNVNPVSFTGLECPESFDVYVRALCGNNISDWSQPATFSLQNCGTPTGEPENLFGCAENGTACFDLTVNTDNVLGQSDPADYTVTYHLSAANANAGTNAIVNPTSYCTTLAMGADEIFIRIENNTTGEFEVVWFTVTAEEILTGQELEPLVACDDDGDGSVTFNLTIVEGQLNTDNVLAYYIEEGDAFTEQNPIANAGAYTVGTASPFMGIYIRENVIGGCDIIHQFVIMANSECGGGTNVCAAAQSLCNAFGQPFSNVIDVESAEQGNDYGCLGSTPNPIWFYLPVSGAGTINLMIEQSSTIEFEEANIDGDFIVYGPFSDPVTPCSGMLTEANIVDCSFSAESVEYPVIENALPGEYYLIMVTNYMNEPGFIRITETADSDGEIDCMGLRLSAFLDTNGNLVKDATESYFTLGQFHYEINNNSLVHHITAPSGVHNIYDSNVTNTYDLSYSINPEYASYYSVAVPSYMDVSLVEGGGLQDYSFPVTLTQDYNDVSVTIIPNDAPRPGFTYTNTIAYTNNGTQAASGTVIFHKDPAVTIVSNSQAGVVPTATGFNYAYTTLQPMETRMIVVTMQVPTIPTVALGDLLTNHAEINPFTGDVAPQNNGSVSTQEIIGSYDPNDKMESRGEQILISEFSDADYLYYTVRFENTGTASAINVRISDSSLDANTMRMISSSHNYVLDRVGSQLTWRFDNILLPPTMEDPDGSKGYVHFKVKPFPGYAVGDEISNTAFIFFDFNPAIVTNTFTSTFVTQLAVNEFETSSLIIYPNPATDFVTIAVKDGADSLTKVVVYDISGKVILTRESALSSETIDLSAAAPGLYLVEISTVNGKTVKKLLID